MVALKLNRPKTSSTKCSMPITIVMTLIVVLVATLAMALYNLKEIQVQSKATYIDGRAFQSQKESYKKWFEKEQPLITEFPIPEKRNDIIAMLEKMKWKTAIEVGVQKGLFAKKMLDNWPSCTEYKLVDLWGREEGYQEPGEHSKAFHENAYKQTIRRTKPHKDKVEFFTMRSTEAAKSLQDNHFDFVYLDARHDYCAVAEDIAAYWPKVRPGGILAGHDFIDAQYAIDRLGEKENWGVCEDGSKQPRAVRGAVEDFAAKENINFILVSQESFPSWFIQKPYEY